MTRNDTPRGLVFLTESTVPAAVVIPDDMGDDERMMMRAIQEFAAREVTPLIDRIEQRDEAVIRDLFRKAADLGIFMAEVPAEHGGLELGLLAIAGMSESRSCLEGLSSTVFAHQGIGTLPLVNFGTPAQIDRYLAGCMDGTLMAAFALTEPESGSDAMSIKTTATPTPDGTGYLLNGSKQWITNAGWADLFILFAKVDGHAFTAFLLERDTPGLVVGPHERLLGLHGSSVCALTLDQAFVPRSAVLGQVGNGHKVAMCTLNLGRMKMAAHCAGTAKKALAMATGYAVERRQFGRPIAEFGLIQHKLADMAGRAYAAESAAYRTAGLVYAASAGERAGGSALNTKISTLAEFAAECAIAKVYGSETYHALADEALQIFGGNGFSEDYPAARMYRDARITRIYEGTSEICRLSIAKSMLKRLSSDTRDSTTSRAVPPARPVHEHAVGSELTRGCDTIEDIRRLGGWLRYQVAEQLPGPDALRGAENQPLLAGLATIAAELYVAESTLLRVLKIQATRPATDTTLAAALARLVLARSTARIRDEAIEILAALYTGASLRTHQAAVQALIPTAENLLALRQSIARGIIARSGRLPLFPLVE